MLKACQLLLHLVFFLNKSLVLEGEKGTRLCLHLRFLCRILATEQGGRPLPEAGVGGATGGPEDLVGWPPAPAPSQGKPKGAACWGVESNKPPQDHILHNQDQHRDTPGLGNLYKAKGNGLTCGFWRAAPSVLSPTPHPQKSFLGNSNCLFPL